MKADQVKEMLALEPLPGEGGFYREMAPGFDFADYTGADRAGLLAAYPRFGELIEALTSG